MQLKLASSNSELICLIFAQIYWGMKELSDGMVKFTDAIAQPKIFWLHVI